MIKNISEDFSLTFLYFYSRKKTSLNGNFPQSSIFFSQNWNSRSSHHLRKFSFFFRFIISCLQIFDLFDQQKLFYKHTCFPVELKFRLYRFSLWYVLLSPERLTSKLVLTDWFFFHPKFDHWTNLSLTSGVIRSTPFTS